MMIGFHQQSEMDSGLVVLLLPKRRFCSMASLSFPATNFSKSMSCSFCSFSGNVTNFRTGLPLRLRVITSFWIVGAMRISSSSAIRSIIEHKKSSTGSKWRPLPRAPQAVRRLLGRPRPSNARDFITARPEPDKGLLLGQM